jgi:hypothetical protein
MSTPISRNNRLRGPVLYAPPRVREQASREEQTEIAEAPEEYEAEAPVEDEAEAPLEDEPESYEAEQGDDEPQMLEDAEGEDEGDGTEVGNEGGITDALDWLDDAIRATVELKHARGEMAGSPPIAPAEQESDHFPPRVAEARRAGPNDIGRTARLRRPRLEAEIVPQPPAEMRQSGGARLFVRIALVILFAATVAYGVTVFSTSNPGTLWLKGTSRPIAADVSRPVETAAPSPPQSRLVVEDQRAFANEPISLAVNVEHAADNETLLLDGLVQGTTLSAGQSTSPYSWQLPSDKLQGLYLYAPKDFVGVMNTTINLLGSDRRLLDSRPVQLKWVAKRSAPASPSAPALATAAPPLVTAEANAGEPIATAKIVSPAVEPIDPAEAAVLMNKGQASLDAGDISGARVAFRRLADAGLADAAFALARTYDPAFLTAHNFLGVSGDRATARNLYQRAKDLGSVQAGQILARMAVN